MMYSSKNARNMEARFIQNKNSKDVFTLGMMNNIFFVIHVLSAVSRSFCNAITRPSISDAACLFVLISLSK